MTEKADSWGDATPSEVSLAASPGHEASVADSDAGAALPLISVVMGVFNGARTLPEAIRSLQEQTYANWELIVCDDSSTDSTPELLNELTASTCNRFVILRNDENRRLAYSLNRCLEVAGGEFIARMDADDVSEPDRFERQLAFLLDHPEVDLVGSAMRRFNEDGLGDVVLPLSVAPERKFLAHTDKAPFFHATILVRRSVFDVVDRYTVSWRTERCEDLDLWYKFFAAGLKGGNLLDPLYLVREDAAAIRRRTPKARFGTFCTRVWGSHRLGYPPSAYVRALAALSKVLIPYRLFDLQRGLLRARAARVGKGGRQA